MSEWNSERVKRNLQICQISMRSSSASHGGQCHVTSILEQIHDNYSGTGKLTAPRSALPVPPALLNAVQMRQPDYTHAAAADALQALEHALQACPHASSHSYRLPKIGRAATGMRDLSCMQHRADESSQ